MNQPSSPAFLLITSLHTYCMQGAGQCRLMRVIRVLIFFSARVRVVLAGSPMARQSTPDIPSIVASSSESLRLCGHGILRGGIHATLAARAGR